MDISHVTPHKLHKDPKWGGKEEERERKNIMKERKKRRKKKRTLHLHSFTPDVHWTGSTINIKRADGSHSVKAPFTIDVCCACPTVDVDVALRLIPAVNIGLIEALNVQDLARICSTRERQVA